MAKIHERSESFYNALDELQVLYSEVRYVRPRTPDRALGARTRVAEIRGERDPEIPPCSLFGWHNNP